MIGRDCKKCVNCDFTRGFMCTCHYSYDTETGHAQVEQYVHRRRANKCEHYSEEEYERDKIFVL